MENLRRDQVDVNLTWDLSLIYKTEEEMFADHKKALALADSMVENYKGKLNSAEMINKCLDDYRKFTEIAILTGDYCSLALEVDYFNTYNMERSQKLESEMSEAGAKLSFIESEIIENEVSVIEKAIELTAANKGFLKRVLKNKPHHLSPETEEVLSTLRPVFSTPYSVYNIAKLADIHFNDFEVEGKKYPNSYTLFEDDYNYEADEKLRRAAFKSFSEKLKEYENVTAAAYNANVWQDKLMAKVRKYDNVFDYLLADQDVTIEMYNRQIDLITTKLAPHMRKYARLLKKLHKLDKMTFADLKIAVDPEYDPKVSVEKAREYCVNGLSILGEEYVEMVKEAFDNRWIDMAQNLGKSTGGFCSSPYGKNSFILMSFNNRMSDVFTLAHELGHAGHFKACNSKQSVFDTEVSTYIVEAPSTMNELVMAHYLLKTSDDKRFRRWVLSCMISNTYYHNFVTHLLEAAYQREVYRIVENGGSVNAPTLSAIKKQVLTDFWGEDVEIDDNAALTWMRQPHYYMGLYSYTYSAGLTVATQAMLNIEKNGQKAVDKWKEVLAAGSTLDPVGLAKLADIDITDEQPLLNTIEYIGSIIDEICKLSEELEN